MKNWNELFERDELIVHRDDTLLIINKPPCIPSQPDTSGALDILSWAEREFSTSYHLLGRLDRPVSGLVALIQRKRRSEISTIRLNKKYLALVSKNAKDEAQLEHYHLKNGRSKKAMLSHDEKPKFKICQLQYKKLHELDHYALIEIESKTGRFHQIRAQLAFEGLPIKGDVKYGARRKNKDRSVDLHAHYLEFPDLNLVFERFPIGRDMPWKVVQDLVS